MCLSWSGRLVVSRLLLVFCHCSLSGLFSSLLSLLRARVNVVYPRLMTVRVPLTPTTLKGFGSYGGSSLVFLCGLRWSSTLSPIARGLSRAPFLASYGSAFYFL